MNDLGVVILAAGKGKRMGGAYPKVLYSLKEKPLIDYVVSAAYELSPARVVLIVGFEKEKVMNHLKEISNLEFAYQEQQLGTGHAVQQAKEVFSGFRGPVLILNGDVPLIKAEELEKFLDFHRMTGAAATIMTAMYDNADGYGRIVRGENEDVLKIVEHKDANDEELKIREINTGIMVFDAEALFHHLSELSSDNSQKEFYLTDMVAILRSHGLKVSGWETPHPEQTYGVNTPEHLEALSRYL